MTILDKANWGAMTKKKCASVVAIGALVLLAAHGGPITVSALAQDSAVRVPESDSPVDSPGSGGGGGPDQAGAPVVRPDDHQEPPPARWNSVASAIWKVRGQVHVAIGYSGIRESPDDARERATDACRSAGGQGCKTVGAWNSGCVYITTGRTTNRAGWSSGPTLADALSKCRGSGFTCKPPIGGCID